MAAKGSVQPPLSVLSITLHEQYSRGIWLPVALAIAAAAFFYVPALLKTVWADWVALFTYVDSQRICVLASHPSPGRQSARSNLYIGDFYIGGFLCVFVTSQLANLGQEMV